MRNLLLAIVLGASLVAVSGCSGEAQATKEEEAKFKEHDASKLSPPPADAMKPPAKAFIGEPTSTGPGSAPPPKAAMQGPNGGK